MSDTEHRAANPSTGARKPREKVLAAMSGGVDSSAMCALLHDAGYDVMGVTMRLLESGTREAEDARRVCESMGLQHVAIEFATLFEDEVVAPFCAAYLAGNTPNPCIRCNQRLKFEALQQHRADVGFDYVATGHYARRCFDETSGRYLLKTGLDPKKDQSYVLYGMTQDQLAHTLFPLGNLTKDQAREIARKHSLATAEKAESQDICFIPDGDYATFIERHEGGDALSAPGPIVLEDGTEVGIHTGLLHYTPGQRKGICVAWSEPLYVLRKDRAANALVVGPAASQQVKELWADQVNLIAVDAIEQRMPVSVKVNYRARFREAQACMTPEGELHVVFDKPIRTCAVGQACVLYQGDVVLGGGTICRYR